MERRKRKENKRKGKGRERKAPRITLKNDPQEKLRQKRPGKLSGKRKGPKRKEKGKRQKRTTNLHTPRPIKQKAKKEKGKTYKVT